jgi:hypothetical protein
MPPLNLMVRQRPRHQRQTGQRMRRRKMEVVPILRGAVSDAACRIYKTLWSARAPHEVRNAAEGRTEDEED